MKPIKTLVILSALIASIFCIQAQNSTITPYSRFGYGILKDRVSSAQAAMGGVGYAMNNGRQINVMNPASYACIDTLTFLFDIGADVRFLNTSQPGADGELLRGHETTAGLNYVTMQFPVTKYMGASVGLLPYSQTGYSFGDKVVNGESTYSGSGTINELYVGLSGKIFKGFTIGANFSYLFGTLLNDEYVTGNTSVTLFERSIDIRDFDVRIGAQYSFYIGRKNRFTVGAVYSPQMSFHGKAQGTMYDTSMSNEPEYFGNVRLKGNADRAATYGGGVNYIWNDRLMLEADFTWQPWKDCKMVSFEDDKDYLVLGTDQFSNRWKTNFGVQYTPDPRGNYLQRVRYRIGAYYDRDYVRVNGNDVNNVGITCGLGLPAPINRLTKTVVNLGFEYMRRSTSPDRLVKENYCQITLGINFNELWFWQNKIQ